MASPETGLASGVGLPFGAEKLARGLEAGIQRWEPGYWRPLTMRLCDVTSLAVKLGLESYNIPATIQATYKAPPEPRTWQYIHAVTVAELPEGPVTIDAVHGQYLPKVLGYRPDTDFARKFIKKSARCAIFPSGDFEQAIDETMIGVFGDEADDALLQRAQEVYGEVWNPANFRPYEPNSDAYWIADRIMPRMQDILDLHLYS